MHTLISQLLHKVQTMQERYEEVKSTNSDYDFYNDVVPFTQEIDALLKQFMYYKTSIIDLPYMNLQKYQLLISNIEELSVECHFQRTSRKLFTEKLKAVQYDLSYIQRSETQL
ncbi:MULTISPECIES: DUF1798 family protein [Staphylococcus]|uniref:DUF1798 family protein n=1 Tax=Staphylococcus hsinchuensis TaxID=3051183 RepID=A0ABZ3ECN7_9STAP|nr:MULTISPECIES: DUF1798 family protein [unclassified Staphylococcus]